VRGLRHGDRERGAGTVLALGLIAVVVLLMLALGLMAGAQGGRWRAQTAADLAALAGAAHLLGASGDVDAACAVAREAVERNGGVLRDCAHEGAGVLGVAVDCPTPAGRAHATARAGPVTARWSR